jgi:hypothetical protein
VRKRDAEEVWDANRRVPLGAYEENMGSLSSAEAAPGSGSERTVVDGGALKRARNARLLEAIQAARETMVASEQEDGVSYEDGEGVGIYAEEMFVGS